MKTKKTTKDLLDIGFEAVVFAADVDDCPDCGEPYCSAHGMHYAECPCLGPTEDDTDYLVSADGVLMGRRDPDAGTPTEH